MIKSLTLLIFLTLSTQAQALDFKCRGIIEKSASQSSGEFSREEIDLEVKFDTIAFQRQVADIGPVHFFAQRDKKDDRFLMMITLGPDYTRGVTSSLKWDGQSPMRVTRVDGNMVYKVVCN